ncbi:MAG: tRNA pseudouridine(38-40) synthase TruA [Clostridiales bacterium]|nr:tRNA pseudouridine(38-40) synthase TruA [Clostridiales bacterium]
MRRIKLEIAYDGTRYCGWQVQPEEITVEGLINEKLSQLLGEKIEVIGASRTDSGVHAMGNVAVFDTNSSIPAEKFAKALNVRLPEDIRVQTSCEVPIDFHPRRTECVKTYEYRIQNRKIEMPMDRLYSYFVYVDLDIEAMQRAAEYLVGTHDYKSFCSVKTQVLDTVRTIYSIKVSKKEDIIYIRIKGNGFLYNMVRIIVGTLINVGRGFHSPEKVLEILKACDRSLAGPTAPAKGLTLVKIEYNI